MVPSLEKDTLSKSSNNNNNNEEEEEEEGKSVQFLPNVKLGRQGRTGSDIPVHGVGVSGQDT
jgi:hypothetical protein